MPLSSDPSVDYPPELVSFVTDELNTIEGSYTRRYFSQMTDRLTVQPATTERPSLVPPPDWGLPKRLLLAESGRSKWGSECPLTTRSGH